MIPEILAASVAAAAGAGVMAYGVFAPRSRLLGPLIWRGDAAAPSRVALTFDDGPHPEATPRTLDVLAKAGARATFFLIGTQAERWPGIVKRIVEEGHRVGNHSFTHSQTGGFRLIGYWQREIELTSRLLEDIAGVRTAWFRPPFGVKQWHMHVAVRRARHAMITYTQRGLDGLTTTADKIVARLVPAASAGSILTLHDGSVSGGPRPIEPTLEALPRVIDGLRARGLTIAPLDELIAPAPYASPMKSESAAESARASALQD